MDTEAESAVVLKVSCPDRPGIVAAVATVIAGAGGNILESSQFNDRDTGWFFMRVRFTVADAARVETAFAPEARRLGMEWHMQSDHRRGRVLLLVSRLDHCLVDLLYQWRTGSIPMEVVGVASNHDDLRPLVEAHGLPYHHLPVTPETRPRQEAALRDLIAASGAELVVLARYMQILSDQLAGELEGRAINIHHSFLPGFKGARPYHQAHARGVKLIGATAHYVTSALDEGPIIEQDVQRVTHADGPASLAEIGRHLEARALARAVRWHLEQRVFLNGTKTVVFRY